MRIMAGDAARVALTTVLDRDELSPLRAQVATLRVAPLAPPRQWTYDATSRVLTLSADLFEDDAVALCHTDELAQAMQREAALRRVLAEALLGLQVAG